MKPKTPKKPKKFTDLPPELWADGPIATELRTIEKTIRDSHAAIWQAFGRLCNLHIEAAKKKKRKR